MSFHYSGHRGFDAERTAVQAFAWSAPMRDLAKLIGISDVALKKQLNKLGIVTPPQGHWNRVAAGRPVPLPPPMPRRPGQTGRVRLDERFKDHIAAASPWLTTGPFVSVAVPEDLDELRAIERKAIGRCCQTNAAGGSGRVWHVDQEPSPTAPSSGSTHHLK